ncbi:MAG: NAD(P)/FAD-dependent oxidoreductase [Planctomycetaceae bacterium]|jgi:NADH dehydrogenase|nr:NAD(P)/FAD-dependent oxidoreductase [Planctomycetaceae bacterium]
MSYRTAIIGAGFAGLSAAQRLSRSADTEILLIDRNNYHTFFPLLYQVAAAELESEEITSPLRGLLRANRRVSVMRCDVQNIDVEQKVLHTDGPDIHYDYLILAMGSVTNFFAVPGAEQLAFTLKSLEDAVLLRSHILNCLEQAALLSESYPTVYPGLTGDTKTDRQSALTHTVIAGGGANGVEFAGALMELIRTSIVKDFPELPKGSVSVTLIEAAGSLLPGFPAVLSEYTRRRLKKMGVSVRTDTSVTEVRSDAVVLGDGTVLPCATVVWTAGVRAPDLAGKTGLPAGRSGRLQVLPTLQTAVHPEIFAAGDLSIPDGMNLPMVAPNAIQQGTLAADNLIRLIRNEPLKPFVYHDKGSMAVVGRGAAVVRIGNRTLSGWFAWLMWLAIHLTYLVGFHNRIMVMFNWAWDYFCAEKSVRLIFRNDKNR